jgi:hypothetical protein
MTRSTQPARRPDRSRAPRPPRSLPRDRHPDRHWRPPRAALDRDVAALSDYFFFRTPPLDAHPQRHRHAQTQRRSTPPMWRLGAEGHCSRWTCGHCRGGHDRGLSRGGTGPIADRDRARPTWPGRRPLLLSAWHLVEPPRTRKRSHVDRGRGARRALPANGSTLSRGSTPQHRDPGIELNALVGRRFKVGNAECFGQRLCESCAHLQRLTSKPGTLRDLIHKGGLRADVLTDGEIHVGSEITPP